MRTIIFLLFVSYGSCFSENDGKPEKIFIAGGDYAEIKEVPYQASLIKGNTKVYCGASIIDRYWLVTAAHCLQYVMIDNIVVRTGTNELKGVGVRHDIEYVTLHPDYNDRNADSDIALIKLKTPIEFNENQTSIPIATAVDIPRADEYMLISGFGRIGEYLKQPDILKKGFVPITNQSKCELIYLNLDPITDNMFCAGEGVVDACDGDSGGPGVVNNKLYGVISNGKLCPSKRFPGVYTRVHLYYNWIVNTTGIKFSS